MIRLDRRLLSMALGALALLHAWPVSAQIAASGTALTVTSANAVATFHGADLVGFVNSLTNEQYLKKPSTGTFANVDVMTPTGQGLQVSNWTIGTESGSGLPLATATLSDSVRSMTITVQVDPASQEIVLRVNATVTTGGARGASWSIAGLDLAAGRWIVPANSGAVFDANNIGVNAFIKYPNSWQAQMAVYEAAAGSLLLYSTDSQYLFKSLRQTSRGDTTLDVSVYTEATAPWLSATTVPAVEWRMKAFAGDWRAAAAPYRDWMLANRPPASNAAHPWVSNIRNVVAVGALDSTILAPLAAQLNPAQTLLYLVTWRQSNYDVNYPDYTPAAGAAAFVTAAHALGFKVMLHTDILGVAPTNADYASVQQYQTRTPDTLQLMGWNWDQTTVPERYGLIDPAASAYRALWIARIGVAINLLNPDALHLDFTAMYNDGNGPIEGRTFPQGEDYFNQQIVTAFPNIALGSEEEFDFTYRYHSFAQMGFWAFQSAGHPISNFLFSPQVEFYGHLATPQVTDPAFKAMFMRQMQIGAFPLWWIYSPSFIDTTNPDIARFIQIAEAWQNNIFQPAWTEDWTGALIRYQGVNGASAVLTDSGGLFSLRSSRSTLFTLAHDANQVSSADAFIDRWAAFDNSTLYGLDPSVLYFLDTETRPDSPHATSLPPGIRLGPGTLMTPSFAHLELAPAAAFDFTDLSNAGAGVSYQGVDYPLGFGAFVQTQTNTVGGVNRSDISIQPPWQGQIGGETFAAYTVAVPAGAALQFSVGIDDGATCTDGVTFRVTAGGIELWNQNVIRGAWHDVVLSLAAYAGRTVPIRLISDPGPAANPSCDRAGWSEVALTAPTPAISVPITLASASIFSGIDGASYTPISGSTGTVTNAAVPGAFTVFTQPGSAIVAGTNLATLPFDVWHWDKDGSTPKPGSVFNAGTVQSETSGGVTKNPAIWAHPPNASRTVLSWPLRLPANPLRFGWSAGLIDGANSDDGVSFEVRVNGMPYWTLTTGVHGDDHWTAGQLDLSRWQGQSILLELITDSRSNSNSDWAAWADLILGTSAGGCSYSVPSSASAGAIGGTLTAAITTSSPCPWSAVPNVPWITIIAGSGAGNGTVTFDVGPNSGAARGGTLTIAGSTLTITQAASTTLPPSIVLQPLSQTVAPSHPFSLSVVAIGAAPLSYQWYAGASGDISHPLPSSGSTYSATASATCCFWVRVSNAEGQADSATAVITVGTGATPPGPGGGANLGGSPAGDAFLYKPSTGAWSMQLSSAGTFIGINSGAWAANWTIQAGDFNGDGLTDLFLYNPTTGQWFKAMNQGAGTFTFFGGTWAPNWTITLLDFDGDGKTDVFLYNPTNGHWFRAMSVGAGDFSYFAGAWAPGWSIYPADFNGDGRADLFLYNHNATSDPNHGLWFRVITQADGSFTYLPGDVRWANTWTVTPADLNGDGLTDLFLYNSTNGQYFRVAFVNGVATYTGGVWGPNWTIVKGDFNGDGRADLFLYNKSNGMWFVVISNPDGTLGYFGGQWAPNWDVTVTDFDADGRSDILLYNATTGMWFQALTVNPGSFTFTTGNWGTGWNVIGQRTIVP